MKSFLKLLKSELTDLYSYRIIVLVTVLTFVFAMAMGLFPELNHSNFFYFNIFVLPVIIFSVSMFISRENNTLIPYVTGEQKPLLYVFAKIIASVIVELIPIVAFIIMMRFTKIDIQYGWLFLAYLLGVILHIIIAISVAIISHKTTTLSINYLAYIIVFSASAILFSNGLIPLSSQYAMLISPAFLSAVLIDNILAGSAYSATWLIVLSVILQFLYGSVLILFVIRPYFKTYLLHFYNHQS